MALQGLRVIVFYVVILGIPAVTLYILNYLYEKSGIDLVGRVKRSEQWEGKKLIDMEREKK